MTEKLFDDDAKPKKKKGDDEGEGYSEGHLDGDPDFADSFLQMSDEHWEKEDPEFHEMMMKHRKIHSGTDKDAT